VRISAVALFSDPQREDNSNVIVGTNQARPDVPDILQKAIGSLASDPSFAQMQLTLGDTVESLLGQTGLLEGQQPGTDTAGQNAGDAPASTIDAPDAGDTTSETESQAPTSTSGTTAPEATSPESTIPEGSATPDAGDVAESTTPTAAGASWTRGGRIQLAADPPAANTTDLQPVTEGDEQTGDRDPNTGTINATIDRDGGLHALHQQGSAGPKAALSREELARRGTEGHVWNRSNADKDKRRAVIDALYLYNSDICTDKTLQQCRDAYVDATTGTHPGLLVPSTDLNAMVTELAATPENGDLQLPDGPTLSRLCGGDQQVSADECRRSLQWSAASEPATVRSANLGGLAAGTGDPKTFETLARATAVTAEGQNAPITSLGTENQGLPIADTNRTTSLLACQNSTDNANTSSSPNWRNWVDKGFPNNHTYEATPGSGYNHQSNAWLLGAWQIALRKREDETRYIDWPREKLLANTAALGDCYAWAALTAQDFLAKYLSHQIVYNDDKFVPPNGPGPGRDNPRAAGNREHSVGELYSYGGCGQIDNQTGVETLAPNGPWSLDTCRGEYLGKQSRYGQLSDNQIAQFVTLAKTSYEQNRPAWTRDALTLSEVGIAEGDNATLAPNSPRRPQIDVGCGPYAVNQCAAFKTRIDPAAEPPSGQQTFVQPQYPTSVDGALVAPKGESPTQTVSSESEAAELSDRGFILADERVLAQVANLDLANKQLREAPGSVRKASTLIKRDTPDTASNNSREGDPTAPAGTVKSVTDMSQADIDQHLAHGWVWGRTEAQDSERPKLVYGIYTLGGCSDTSKKQQTWSQCFDKYSGRGDSPQPENALSNDELQAMIDQLRPHADQLPWVSTSFPADLSRECRDKIAEQCAGQKQTPTTSPAPSPSNSAPAPSTTTPSAPPATRLSGDDNTSDTTDDATGATTTPEDTSPTTTDVTAGATDGSQTSTSVPDAGSGSTDTSAQNAGAPTGTDTDGGLASSYADLITGGTTSGTATTVTNTNGDQIQVNPITQRAVAGGGLAGQRDSDFGELTGRVISFCVPGDLVCSLPENTELARDLTKFAQNVSVNFPDMLSDEGATRMGGLLALQGLNMVADVTGMPRTKLSADTLQALINIAAGGVMIATENPAGAALVADGVAKLPDALPEAFAQLRDIPEILRRIPTTPDTVLKNTGLDKQVERITAAFEQAGMTSPLEVDKYPQAANALMEGLVKDNTGVVKLVTDPQYWKANAHILYPELKVAGDTNSVDWVQAWMDALVKLARGGQ
jgi:hypothetical protein